jgi:hypothetical protein
MNVPRRRSSGAGLSRSAEGVNPAPFGCLQLGERFSRMGLLVSRVRLTVTEGQMEVSR